MDLWTEAFQAARETGDAMGLYNVSRDLGAFLVHSGLVKEGRHLLEEAVTGGRKGGLPGVSEMEELLASLRRGEGVRD